EVFSILTGAETTRVGAAVSIWADRVRVETFLATSVTLRGSAYMLSSLWSGLAVSVCDHWTSAARVAAVTTKSVSEGAFLLTERMTDAASRSVVSAASSATPPYSISVADWTSVAEPLVVSVARGAALSTLKLVLTTVLTLPALSVDRT